jgi:hypothetical protein
VTTQTTHTPHTNHTQTTHKHVFERFPLPLQEVRSDVTCKRENLLESLSDIQLLAMAMSGAKSRLYMFEVQNASVSNIMTLGSDGLPVVGVDCKIPAELRKRFNSVFRSGANNGQSIVLL